MTVRKNSVVVYNKIKELGLLSPRRWAIYEVLWPRGPMTYNEVFQQTHGAISISQSNTGARLNEMCEMGCVERVGDKFCSVTNNYDTLYDVTDQLPRKLNKKLDFTRIEMILKWVDHHKHIYNHLKMQSNVPQKWLDYLLESDKLFALSLKYEQWRKVRKCKNLKVASQAGSQKMENYSPPNQESRLETSPSL